MQSPNNGIVFSRFAPSDLGDAARPSAAHAWRYISIKVFGGLSQNGNFRLVVREKIKRYALIEETL